MVENVEILQNSSFSEIIISGKLTVMLLRTYSKLYTNGEEIRTCKNSLNYYHKRIINNGQEKAMEYKEIEQRTCVPAWNGLRYSSKACTHISDVKITDAQAIKYLKDGVLKESDFKVLPKGYNEIEQPTIKIAETPTYGTFSKPKKIKK